MDMIERVARAIAEAHLHSPNDPPFYFEALTEEIADEYYKMARAAIGEMRENTPVMSEAMRMANMNAAGGYGGPSGWEAAIDAALKEHEGKPE